MKSRFEQQILFIYKLEFGEDGEIYTEIERASVLAPSIDFILTLEFISLFKKKLAINMTKSISIRGNRKMDWAFKFLNLLGYLTLLFKNVSNIFHVKSVWRKLSRSHTIFIHGNIHFLIYM